MKLPAKSLIFYIIFFLEAIVFFNLITFYGKRNLKAAPSIGGIYNLSSDDDCFNTCRLTIERSGIYLQGILYKNNLIIPLQGFFQDTQFVLVNSNSVIILCNNQKIKLFTENNQIKAMADSKKVNLEKIDIKPKINLH